MATRKTTPKKAPKASAPKARTTRAKKTTANKGNAPQAPAKKPRTAKAKEVLPAKKLSQFQAAIRVLVETGEPMTCRAMVEAMTAQGLWASPGGKTPEATLYASILRDTRKGDVAQFRKVDRGLFALASQE